MHSEVMAIGSTKQRTRQNSNPINQQRQRCIRTELSPKTSPNFSTSSEQQFTEVRPAVAYVANTTVTASLTAKYRCRQLAVKTASNCMQIYRISPIPQISKRPFRIVVIMLASGARGPGFDYPKGPSFLATQCVDGIAHFGTL